MQMIAHFGFEVVRRHRLAVHCDGRLGSLGSEFCALASADLRKVAQKLAVVHNDDVMTGLLILTQAKLAVKNTHQRAELNAILLDEQNHAVTCLKPGDSRNLQCHVADGAAEELQDHHSSRVPL